MKKHLLHIVLCLCFMQNSYTQEDGVVSFNIPVRNSLKFNKYIMNPTFSFVREQNKYISFYNKRQWVQFDDAPNTYLFSYSGRFRENIGIGVGLFQQDYGVLTTFGGVLNFAYNVRLDRESNLTFGMNLGFYKSGLNEGKVITNFPDPSLDKIPSNSLITINPGLNYGTTFLDFGVSLNNLVLYNINESELIEDNPEQSIQAHLMYTGYISSRGFFDESKFSGLIRSEFKKSKTIVSGIVMLTIPKGIWAQTGYNSLYGISAGMGINISTQISMEYNYEKAIGDLSLFGSSHEITLAYKFKNKGRYNYSGDDDEEALIIPTNKKGRSSTTKKAISNAKPYKNAEARAKIKAEAVLATEAITIADEEAKAKVEEETRIAENKAKVELEEKERLATEVKTKVEEETRLAENKDIAETEERERIALETKELVDAKAKVEEERLLAEAEEEKWLVIENKERLDAETKAKMDEEAVRIKTEEVAKLILEAEKQAKADEDARVELAEEVQAKVEEEARIKLEELDEIVIPVPTDNTTRAMYGITELTEESKIIQHDLLIKLQETVDSKEQDLKDLKEENDLSEKGIFKAPKPFKSISAQNIAIESLKLDLDEIIKTRNEKIKELEALYNKRRDEIGTIILDEVDLFYQKTIKRLQSEQVIAIKTRSDFEFKLVDIKTATEFERKRRIKRAAYDNEDDKYLKDRAMLQNIKLSTSLGNKPLKPEDFDFGEEQSNIQIVKDIKNEESGYYLVVAVHRDVAKRDDFLTKAVSAGETNINFFYDVNTSKYFIYYQKFDGIDEAIKILKTKGSKPYNSKMSVVKIEN